MAAETRRAVRDVGGPGDKTAEQSLIVGVKARYEKVHNVGDVLEARTSQGGGEVAFWCI